MFGRLSKTAPVVAALACLAIAPVTAHAQKVDEVTLGWPSQLSVSMAHIAFGQELGFFEEENINLQIESSNAGSLPLLQQLQNGGLDVGYIAVESLIIAEQNQGITFALQFAYNYMRRSIWEMIVLADSPVNEVTDLAGKTIGVGSPAFGNVPITKAILRSSGVDPESVSILGVGLGGSAFRALRAGDIDVLNLFDTMHAALEASGVPIKRIPLPSEYTDHSSQGFMFHKDTIAENPDLVERIGRAMAKSTIACDANAEGCVKAFWKQRPGLKPSGNDDLENLRRQKLVVETRQSRLMWFPDDIEQKFGAFREKDWELLLQEMTSGGTIKEAPADASKYYTNDFVDAFNDFDTDEVIQRAKNWK